MQASPRLSSRLARDQAVSQVLASAAIGLPMLLAFNLPPSSTFLNQAAALIGWGGWLTLLASSLTGPAWPRGSGLMALQTAFALLLLSALAAPLWAGVPWSLALSSAGLILAAALTAQTACALQHAGLGRAAFRAFCIGLIEEGGRRRQVEREQHRQADGGAGQDLRDDLIAGQPRRKLRRRLHHPPNPTGTAVRRGAGLFGAATQASMQVIPNAA